jgi:hypothetical protein
MGVPLPLRGYPLKVLGPGPATNMLFLQIYQKYFIIEQTYNKNKLFYVVEMLFFSHLFTNSENGLGRGPGSKRLI